MIFYCFDLKTKGLIFKFSNSDDTHDCISSREINNNEGCTCGKDRYFIVKQNEKSGHIFAICFDGIHVRKEAIFFAKQTIDMFLMSNPIIDAKHNHYEEIVKASIHNTKNLNSQITSKILSYLKEDSLSVARDKVAYIEQIVKADIKAFSREILSILKMSSHINSDYNVIDYLKPNITIKKNEFGYKKLHSLLVISFYQFEADFNKNGNYFRITPTELSVYVNYNTVQTLLTHLFTNALRYCMPNTEISVKYSTISNEFVEIHFTMRSLELTDEIIRDGRLNGVRSEQAIKKYSKGTGMGLGIIHALSVLNRGSFEYHKCSETIFEKDGYKYTDNCFKLTLLKNEFYEN